MNSNFKQAREQAVLDRVFRYQEGTMSRRAWLALMKSRGGVGEIHQVRQGNKEQKERESLERLYSVMPFGNQNHPSCIEYYKRKALLDKGFFKDEYTLKRADENWSIVITKIEYDYFTKSI
jgi:hypothetical protein